MAATTTATTASMAAAAAAAASPHRLRVVTYNVLSSHLASPDHFTKCRPDELDFSVRMPRVLNKLRSEMDSVAVTAAAAEPCCSDRRRSSGGGGGGDSSSSSSSSIESSSGSGSGSGGNMPVIFCLQEVSHSWAGYLHTFFANRGYHMITGLYGRRFNDYMGVALAYPTAWYKTLDVDVARLSDCRVGGWPRPPSPPPPPPPPPTDENKEDGDMERENARGLNYIATVARKVRNMSSTALARGLELLLQPARRLLPLLLLQPPPTQPNDHWVTSENRSNILLTARLRPKIPVPLSNGNNDNTDGRIAGNAGAGAGDDDTFLISTYHMPCAFYAPMVMNIHAEMAARRCQTLAAKTSTSTSTLSKEKPDVVPYILAGDFNILPDSPHYRLLTKGRLDLSDPTYPTPKHGMEWNCDNIVAMTSAYGSSDHGEPDFTNYAQVKDDEPFIGTLDYIFLSDQWDVSAVKHIPHRKDVIDAPFPNSDEPSDHVLISADLVLRRRSSTPASFSDSCKRELESCGDYDNGNSNGNSGGGDGDGDGDGGNVNDGIGSVKIT